MKKLTTQNLNELQMTMPIILPEEMRNYVGGGSYTGGSTEITYDGGTLQEVVCTASYSKTLPTNWAPLLYQLQQAYGSYTSSGGSSYDPNYYDGSSSGGGSGGGGNFSYDPNYYGGGSSNNYGGEYLGGSLWKAGASITLNVIESLGSVSTQILDDRGSYYAPGAIYEMDMPITVRLPMANMNVSTKILNVARVGGKWVGVVGDMIDFVEIGTATVDGRYYEAGAKFTRAAAQVAVATLVPGVGWAIALGIGGAEAIWGDDLYEYLNNLNK